MQPPGFRRHEVMALSPSNSTWSQSRFYDVSGLLGLLKSHGLEIIVLPRTFF
jgi:hypothetical protein